MARKTYKVRKAYAYGGKLPFDKLFQLGAMPFNSNMYTSTGAPDVGNMTMGGAFSGAGTGFGLGNAILPGIGGLVGGGIGAIVGGLTGNSKAQKAKEEYDLAKRKEKAFETKLKEAETASLLNTYPSKGQDRTTLFAKGGDLQGGVLKNVAPGVTKAEGRKHEEGGIDFTHSGKDVEIEDDEVMYKGRYIFSDRVKVPGTNRTFAETAEAIAKSPAYIKDAMKQKKLMMTAENPLLNRYIRGTATRNLQKIESPLDRLFKMQEAHTQELGLKGQEVNAAYGADLGSDHNLLPERLRMLREDLINKYGPQAMDKLGTAATGLFNRTRSSFNLPPAPGLSPSGTPNSMNGFIGTPATAAASVGAVAGTLHGTPAGERSTKGPTLEQTVGRGIGAVAPFIDNMVNAGITKRTPPIPTPTYVKTPRLKTDFNIEPQLGQVNRAAAARNRLLTANTSNPQVARANILAGTANDMQARNQLYGQKENIETQLTNKQQLLDYENQQSNASKFDNFRYNKMLRRDDIGRRISMNAANLSEDLQFQNRERNQKTRDKQELALIATQYADSGVIDRAGLFEILGKIDEGMTLDEINAYIKNRKKKTK